jgi:hypothetical protein
MCAQHSLTSVRMKSSIELSGCPDAVESAYTIARGPYGLASHAFTTTTSSSSSSHQPPMHAEQPGMHMAGMNVCVMEQDHE